MALILSWTQESRSELDPCSRVGSVLQRELFRILEVHRRGRACGSISPKKEFCRGHLDHSLPFPCSAYEKGGILGLNSNPLSQNPAG